jgi:hypothetical protein
MDPTTHAILSAVGTLVAAREVAAVAVGLTAAGGLGRRV